MQNSLSYANCARKIKLRFIREKISVTFTPTKPFEVVSIDTVGPLPKSNHNNRYALTLQCDLTKYVVLIPLQTKEANAIARALINNFILIYGNFLELKSDQGTEFKNEVLDQICHLLHIKQTFSTAYHPQTIGSLERNHRCLNEYLRFQTDRVEPVYNLEAYKNELRYKIQKSNCLAREKLIAQKLMRSQKSEQTSNPIEIQIGDQVYLTNENRRKLDSFYNGPYLVTQIDNQNCKIQHQTTNNSLIVHKNRLIK